MKKQLILFITAFVLALAACAPQNTPAEVVEATPTASPAPTAEPTPVPEPAFDRDVAILYTNDVHCAVDGDIGYAGLAALKNELQDDGCYVALVDAGDAIQGAAVGTLSEGEYLIDMMNKVGYDVAVPGNHEFDYGMDRFFELTKKADFPYVSANFIDLTTGEPALAPYTMLEFNGVMMAFVGVSTPRTISSSTPSHFQNAQGAFIYGFCQDADGSKLYATVQNAVDKAREQGARYVIAVGHLGIEEGCSPWTAPEVIANTSGIDVFIDGHSHSTIECARVKNKDGVRVLHSQTGTGLGAVGLLYITKEGSLSTGLITSVAQKDAGVEAYIQGIEAQYEELLNTVVAASSVDLVIYEPGTEPPVRIVRNAETNLGDLCADAFRSMTGADIALVNGGGVRTNIPAGDITYGNVISVQPFGNMICVAEASGQEIVDALEIGARAVPSECGGFLQVSGLTYEINTAVASTVKMDENNMFVAIEGERRVQNVLVDGTPIDLEKTYTVAGYDNMIKEPGDGCTLFLDNPLLLDSVMLDNQMLINYITDVLGGVVGEDYADPHGQGRIVAAE